MLVDAHTHIFSWGDEPGTGWLSRRIRRRWLTRFLIKISRIDRAPGDTLTAKLRHHYLREVAASRLDRVVCLAQDAVYRHDGSRDDAATHFHTTNDYVLELARRTPKLIPGCSINPWRRDARDELDRVSLAGCRLVKVHTAIQGVDPADARFDPFYRHAAALRMVLMFHTGYEHAAPVVSQSFADPRRLARPLESGASVIAAHCGTCSIFDPEDFTVGFVEMMKRYNNLYGDTSILATLARWRKLADLERLDTPLRGRLLHGSDFPFPPARLPYLRRLGARVLGRWNPLDLDLEIKQKFDYGPHYTDRVLDLIGETPAPRLPTKQITH